MTPGKQLALIIGLCLATRLPVLMGSASFLDGDECVVALMAKHLIDGAGVSPYFYGQAYGFSLFEILPIALGYLVLGFGQLAVKLAMLSMWTAGVVCFHLALRKLAPKDPYLALLVTLVLVCTPAWALWSMKARGGYLTAFVANSLILLLLFDARRSRSVLWTFVCGLLLVLIYQSQVLWLLGLLPIVAHRVFVATRPGADGERTWLPLMGLCGGVAAALLAFFVLRATCFGATAAPPPGLSPPGFGQIASGLVALPGRLVDHFAGDYYLFESFTPALVVKVFAMAFTALLLLAFAWSIYRASRRLPAATAFTVAVICCIAPPTMYSVSAPRYLLPLSGVALLLMFACADRLASSRLRRGLLAGLVLLGAASCVFLASHVSRPKAPPSTVRSLIESIEAEGIEHVFVADALLQWQVVFYSNERIRTRFHTLADRYPPYVRAVNAAFADPAERVALVGHGKPVEVLGAKGLIQVGDLFLFLDPDRAALEQLGFRFE